MKSYKCGESMKIKPVVYERIQTKHTSFVVDLKLDFNITFICGDSGVGRSTVFSILKEMAAEDKKIRCFNYLDQKRNYKASIRQSKGNLFVIDNADILMDDKMRGYIAFDENNQYIIIGRNPSGLLLDQNEIYELDSKTADGITKFALKKRF